MFHACEVGIEKIVYALGLRYPNHLQTDETDVLYLTEEMVGAAI